MLPSIESIALAAYGAASFDVYLSMPKPETLREIRSLGLEQYLPSWINFETGEVQQEGREREIFATLHYEYPSFPQFCAFFQQQNEQLLQQQETGTPLPTLLPADFRELNSLLLKEILTISPAGKVNETVYKISTARVNKAVGLPHLRELYLYSLATVEDPGFRAYSTLLHAQLLQDQQRFVEELPLLEIVLRGENGKKEEKFPDDVSEIDVLIIDRLDKDGNRHQPQRFPFL